ncbi:hypothetical protein DH86_00002304, partial [Scytalidium sp. 3C]
KNDQQALLENLVGWLIRYTENNKGALVTRKLCSALVTYFLHFPETWTKCIRHLIYCLCIGQAVPYDSLESAPETSILLQSTPKVKGRAVLWFAAALAEEVGKTDSNLIKHHKFHEQLKSNVNDVVPLIAQGISRNIGNEDIDVQFTQEAMKCYQVSEISLLS